MTVEYRLVFGSNIDLDSSTYLRARICDILAQPDIGGLTVLFSSDGGSTDCSIALYNFICQLPIPVGMHAVGHVGSAAVPVFLAGSKRTACLHSRFFLHGYDWSFGERQMLNGLEEAVQRLRSDIEFSQQIIKARTSAPDNLLQCLDGQSDPVLLLPEQAMLHGFIDKVCDLGDNEPNGMKAVYWS